MTTKEHPVASGTKAEFSVKATGDEVQFQWKKDSTELHDDSKYHGTQTDTLHIEHVEKSDKGRYECLVKNYKGQESEKANLVVSKLVINVC